jgi:hypothetical protein
MEASVDVFEEFFDKMNITDLEDKRGNLKSIAEHLDSPKEEAPVKTVRALVDRNGDRHVVVGLRRQLEKRTQGDGGRRKKLVAARKRMSCLAESARRKERGNKRPTVEQRRRKKLTRGKVARGISIGETFWKKR